MGFGRQIGKFVAKKLYRGAVTAVPTTFELADRAALLGAKGAWGAAKGAYKLLRPSSGNIGKGSRALIIGGITSAPILGALTKEPSHSTVQRLNLEYMKGLRGMPKLSSVQMTVPDELTKTAGRGGALFSAIKGALSKAITGKNVEAIKNWIVKNPLATAGLGLGSLGMVGAYELMDRPADTASYLIGKQTFPLLSRVRADETFAEEFFKSLGKETARRSLNIAGGMLQQGATAAQRALGKITQGNIVNNLMKTDDIISRADPETINTALDTMSRFAPTLATDPNAVRSFLREAVTYGSGPDYATISNIAGAESRVARSAIPNFGMGE